MTGVLHSALRVQGGNERAGMRPYGAIDETHPAVGSQCAVCSLQLRVGDIPTVIPLGPGADPDDQARARTGRWYSALGVIAHAACAGLSVGEIEVAS